MSSQIQDLIIEVSNGSEQAFEEIYKLYFSTSYNTAHILLNQNIWPKRLYQTYSQTFGRIVEN